jgi:hypothetical protein
VSALDNAKAAHRDLAASMASTVRMGGCPTREMYAASDSLAALIAEHERVLAERAAPQEWEYGYELIEADTRDVLTRGYPFPDAGKAATQGNERAAEESEIGEPVLACVVRRRPNGPWEPLPEDTNQTDGEV